MIDLTERRSTGMDVLNKVGPKGYIHGWIFVGAPGVGAEVYHPQHGRGVVTAHDGTHATVKFHSGETHSFEAAHKPGAEHHFEPRGGAKVEAPKHRADALVAGKVKPKDLSDDELKASDKEFERRAALMGRAGDVGKTHKAVKDELARRDGAGEKTPEKPAADYEKLRSAAVRYDATEPPKAGSALRTYEDPEKQKEAIRLHTAARNAAPDAKAKAYHTDEINRHKQYLKQIENNQKIHRYEADKKQAHDDIKRLTGGYDTSPEHYDALAEAHQRAADVERRRNKEMGKPDDYESLSVIRSEHHANAMREYAKEGRTQRDARHARIKAQLPGAQAKVAERERLARETGAAKDIHSAVAGHEEIARHAGMAGLSDVAAQHMAAAAKLRDELDRQKEGGAALAARDKDMQRRKGLEIKQAQRYLDAMDKNPELQGGPKQRAALREASNASIATAGHGGTAKAHEAAAAAYRRYADAAEEAGDKQSADIARGPLARFHDEMAAHVRERRAAGAKLREGFTGGGKKTPKPRAGAKPKLADLEADAKAKEAAAVEDKTPENMRAAATAYRAAAERATADQARQARATEPVDSLSKHTRPDGTLTPEREKLHKKIVDDALAGHEPQEKPIATFLGGGPASGKSTVMGGTEDSAVIDADGIKAKLPEYQQMVAAKDPKAAGYAHEESSMLSAKVMKAAAAKKINFTLDGTGDSKYAKLASKVAEARKSGHKVAAKYVTVDTDEAVNRAMKRAAKTGRMVPESVIRETHANVTDTFKKAIDNKLFDSAELWDNNGTSPKLIGSKADGGDWTVHDQDAWQRFLKKGNGNA